MVVVLASVGLITGCQQQAIRADLSQVDLLACVTAGADAKGKPVTCESSAVAVIGDRVLIANDKVPPAPDSSLVTIPLSALATPREAIPVRPESPAWLANIRKIEEMAPSPDGQYTFVATAFDRDGATAGPDGLRYNNLLRFPNTDLDAASVIAGTEIDGISSSVILRAEIRRALITTELPEGPAYYKIEGLSILPGNRFVFGVREIGATFEKPSYTMILLAAGYGTDATGRMIVTSPFTRYDLKLPANAPAGIGLSALSYDPERQGLFVAASLEKDEGEPLQSFLYFIRQRDVARGKLVAVRDAATREPFAVPYKLEGLARLADGSLIGVCDEDRTLSPVTRNGQTTRRALHEGVLLRITLAH